jgi:hypothetical protein
MNAEKNLSKWVPIIAVALGAIGWGFKLKFDVDENRSNFEQYKKDMKVTVKSMDEDNDKNAHAITALQQAAADHGWDVVP